MSVSPALAQQIVEQMKTIINQEINFIDQTSVIIASTDPQRIGQFHGGANKVLTNNDVLVIEHDHQFEGTKKGINMPVKLHHDTVGVIGITGDKTEVLKYGEIIKQMTEILIKENYLTTLSYKKHEQDRFLLDALLQQSQWSDDTKQQLTLLDIESDKPYQAVALSLKDGINDREHLYHLIDTFLFHYDNCYYMFLNQTCFLLIDDALEQQHHLISGLKTMLEEKLLTSVYIGSRQLTHLEMNTKRRFKEAEMALEWAMATRESIQTYEELDIGLIFSNLDAQTKLRFTDKILGSLPDKEQASLKEVLLTYGHFNKSISKSAEALFIHKNTLQYQLTKIKQYTGYDPRQLNDYVILYLAFQLLQDTSE